MNEITAYAVNKLLSDMKVTFNFSHNFVRTSSECNITEKENGCEMNFKFGTSEMLQHVTVTTRGNDKTVVFSIDAALSLSFGSLYCLLPEKFMEITLGENYVPDKILVSGHDNPWWMFPSFPETFAGIPDDSQGMVIADGGRHYHVLPLCGDNIYCNFEKGKLYLNSGMNGLFNISGDFLAVTVADDPFTAVRESFKSCRELGAINVKLKNEKVMPENLNGLGWCTWDAFHHSVTSAKIYEKLREFNEKKVPIRYVIIDDGWSDLSAPNDYGCMMLRGFDADKNKFPEGIKECVRRMKEEFGVPAVGVWMPMTGGWVGIDPNGPLAEAEKDHLFTPPCGLLIPKADEEENGGFWDDWFGFLAECGVDFVKVDNQSSVEKRIEGFEPSVIGIRKAHIGLERAVDKYFGGSIINCMGMDMQNVQNRPGSMISRNSDDFVPGVHRSFVKHLMQNSYNAIWHGEMYCCDYDMWWTDHESADASGVLRAISGSPVYVSDGTDRTVAEKLLPTVADDGRLLPLDEAARPTLDCFYVDPRESGEFHKCWNRSGEYFAAALFNVLETEVTDTLEFADIPGLDEAVEYLAYSFFEKKFTRFKKGDAIKVTLAGDGAEIINLYPIKNDGEEYVMLGDLTKYANCASAKTKKYIKEI